MSRFQSPQRVETDPDKLKKKMEGEFHAETVAVRGTAILVDALNTPSKFQGEIQPHQPDDHELSD